MASKATREPAKGLLPTLVVTPSDVAEMERQLESINEFMLQAELRKTGQGIPLPKTGQLLKELTSINNLSLLKSADRQKLIAFLKDLKEGAPVVHISFAAEPSNVFMGQIALWFRENVHPQTLVQIGLQPSIAAGCMLRTENKTFDFSLRKRFTDQKQALISRLHEGLANERQ